MERIVRLAFWDFDGTFAHSPTPEEGRKIWEQHHGSPYPHQGWWGRVESMDDSVFDIQLRDDVVEMYRALPEDTHHYIHTSRVLKFEKIIEGILSKFGISMRGILTCSALNKGERILDVVKKYHDEGFKIESIHFTDDRHKEIKVVEEVRHILESAGISLTITKVQSDATD